MSGVLCLVVTRLPDDKDPLTAPIHDRSIAENSINLILSRHLLPTLEQLKSRYKLVVLSNGDPDFLEYLVKHRVRWTFDEVISVTLVGTFKPHPDVYRRAANELGLEVGECLMVSANSFDVMGARACGYSAAFVNRYELPYEDSPYQPDVTVKDFTELANALL